jgi:L-lactate dehydrogenase
MIDPGAFGGADEFTRQMGEIARQCHASKPARSGEAVRLPGERGLALAREQAKVGVALHPSIFPALEPWSKKLGVAMPPAR